MRKFLILIISLSSVWLFGQSKIDSLANAITQIPPNTIEHVDALNQLGLEFWIIDSQKSILYGNQANELATKIQYKKGLAQSNRILGVAHWTLGNSVKSLEFLTAAQDVFAEINDQEGMANSILNTGMVYADLKDYPKALDLYGKAINIFTALDLKGRIATTFTKIATVYIEENRLYDAKEYLTNALNIHSENNFTYGMAEAHNRLGILFIKQEDIEQAYYHIEKSIVLGINVNDRDGMVSNLIQYGKILSIEDKLDVALVHYKLGLSRAKEHGLKKYQLEAYSGLMELKEKQGQLDSSLFFYKKFTALKDTIFNSQKSAQIAALEFNAEREANAKEMDLLKEREKSNRILNWGLIIGVLVLVAMGLIIINSLKQRNKKNRELAARKQQLLISHEELGKTALENARLKQQELEQQLDFRNKELTSYALNFVQKNEFMQQLQEKVRLAKTSSAGDQTKLLDELNRDIKQHLTIDKDWEDFRRSFEEVHTDFYTKLKQQHPGLSANDLKLCALTRLNLNTKETANVLGISPESAKTARYRLRKKLDLSPNDELLDYLLSLENN